MRKAIPFILFVAVAAGLGWAAYNYTGVTRAETKTPPPTPAVPVTAGTAETRDMPVFVRGIGSVQANNTAAIKSRVDGQIVKVDFTEGQEVKAGDLLYEIDPRQFQAAIAQANAAKEKDEASLTSAQADLKRDEELMKHDFQTRQAYDQQKALVGQLTASIKSDQAMIDTAQLNLQYANIRAPFDGRTGARLVDVGNLVHATDNTSLVSITQLRPIFVSFTAPQNQFEPIRAAGAKGAIEAQAYSENDKTKLATGKLTLIDNLIDQATGTIHLKASFENKDDRLWPGEFVNMRLIVGIEKNAVTVPAQAIQQGPSGFYLFVIKPDNTVEIRNVTVSQTENDISVVSKGLQAGEKIVVEGQYRLDQGTKVSTQPPAKDQGA